MASRRLEGWKAVARYLGKDARTALRWVGLGLPVYRVNGRNSSVYAYAEELEEWLRRRDDAGCATPGVVVPLRPPPLARETRSRAFARRAGDRVAGFDVEGLMRTLARWLAQATPAEKRRARRLLRQALAECGPRPTSRRSAARS